MSATLRVFDPAMCCSTGVCGPSVDPDLARFAADLEWLVGQGVTVERHNLAQEPARFAETPAVREALARGTEVLPLVLVGDRIATEGSYPSRETLAALAGVVIRAPARAASPVAAEASGPGAAPAAEGGPAQDAAAEAGGCCGGKPRLYGRPKQRCC